MFLTGLLSTIMHILLTITNGTFFKQCFVWLVEYGRHRCVSVGLWYKSMHFSLWSHEDNPMCKTLILLITNNGFVAICWLWTARGWGQTLLVLELSECSTSQQVLDKECKYIIISSFCLNQLVSSWISFYFN